MASNAGAASPPAWYLNLRSNPHAHIEVGQRTIDVRAREVTGHERAELWQRLTAANRYLDRAARKAGRDLPLMALVPTTPTTPRQPPAARPARALRGATPTNAQMCGKTALTAWTTPMCPGGRAPSVHLATHPTAEGTTMSTILIGVDESTRSEDAIAFGNRLAAVSSAQVVVACAFPFNDAMRDGSGGGSSRSPRRPS